MTDDTRWVHYFADLRPRRPRRVLTSQSVGPTELGQRLVDLGVLDDIPELGGKAFSPPERRLSPRQPYLASPESYVRALPFGWELATEIPILAWRFSNDGDDGRLSFAFNDVSPGMSAVVSLALGFETNVVDGRYLTGNLEVRSGVHVRQTFEIFGRGVVDLDMVVRAHLDVGVVGIDVSWEPDKVTFIEFRQIDYRTV
jgi:hypothetical protein